MILRNKKTNEIKDLKEIISGEWFHKDWKHLYEKLNCLFNKWEEYEELKECEYWYIEADGQIIQSHKPRYINVLLEPQKQIGNYFESREEAVKALKKAFGLETVERQRV